MLQTSGEVKLHIPATSDLLNMDYVPSILTMDEGEMDIFVHQLVYD